MCKGRERAAGLQDVSSITNRRNERGGRERRDGERERVRDADQYIQHPAAEPRIQQHLFTLSLSLLPRRTRRRLSTGFTDKACASKGEEEEGKIYM